MTEQTDPSRTLDIIEAAQATFTDAPTPDPEPITCNRNHDTEHLYYRRPFRGAPDTILACRACDTENAIDAQQYPEPSDLYEN